MIHIIEEFSNNYPARRIQATRNWAKVPLTRWRTSILLRTQNSVNPSTVTFLIYTDSLVFTFTTAIIEHGLGLNKNMQVCGASILLCIAFYLSTKLFIYYFLVEKVVCASGGGLWFFITNKRKYIVRAVSTPRLKSKLWCFNVFGLLRASISSFSRVGG